jgi:predicted porin
MGASYAFSPIGFQGITCGVGNTEDCRFSTSVKYHVDIGQFRVAALWQFGGYSLNNAATGSYQLQLGGDIANLAGGKLSFDAIGSYVQNSVSIALAGSTLPALLPQVLTATLSDNSSVMLVARYNKGPVKLFAGYEFIRYAPPATPTPPVQVFTISRETSSAPAALRSTTPTSTARPSTPATSYSM